jgi:hypothetical protein
VITRLQILLSKFNLYRYMLDWNSFAVFIHKDGIHALNDTLAKIVDSGEYPKIQRRQASAGLALFTTLFCSYFAANAN